MISTSLDVASLTRELWWWEHAEFVFAGLVAVACAGEYVAEFNKRPWVEKRKDSIAKRSTLALVVALVLELICLVRTNQLSGNVMGSLGDKAEEAGTKARVAMTDSSTALSQAKDALAKAGAAQDSLGKAEDEANKAQAVASNALSLARSARQEADSFEKDIVSAKEQAARAEEHLAEALQRASSAEKQAAESRLALETYKAPRMLSPLQQAGIATRLRRFGSMRVDMIIIGDAKEIGDIAGMIGTALQQAGWTVTFLGKAISGPNVSGVFVGTHIGSDRGTNEAAEELILSLQSQA